MKENYLINIEGTIEQDGEADTISMMVRGDFARRNGNFFIRYKETENNGFEGNITTVKVEDDQKVSMLRHGATPSQLVIERGRRHVCHYESHIGSLSLGVAADEIENQLTEAGGNLLFSYTLDTGNSHLSHNQIKITVQEAH